MSLRIPNTNANIFSVTYFNYTIIIVNTDPNKLPELHTKTVYFDLYSLPSINVAFTNNCILADYICILISL